MTEPTKECSKCKETKPISEFYRSKKNKDGLHGLCKTCFKNYAREYYSKNKKIVKAQASAYYRAHKEAVKERERHRYWNSKGNCARLSRYMGNFLFLIEMPPQVEGGTN